MADAAAKRVRGFDTGPANARRRLLDKCGDGNGLRVDPAPDFVEDRRGAIQQRIERTRETRFRFADARGCGGTRAFDLSEVRDQPLCRAADLLIRLACAFTERRHMVGKVRGSCACLASNLS